MRVFDTSIFFIEMLHVSHPRTEESSIIGISFIHTKLHIDCTLFIIYSSTNHAFLREIV